MSDINKKTTNWYVITGGPGSGKTTTVNLLQAKGYKTTIEFARHYLDLQRLDGHTVEEVRENQAVFQKGVLDMQVQQEQELNPDELVFLDRAIPDSRAYYRFLNMQEDPLLTEIIKSISYKKIFILECLPMVNDYARREDEVAQKKIHETLIDVYQSLHFPIVHVPVLHQEERVDFILNNL